MRTRGARAGISARGGPCARFLPPLPDGPAHRFCRIAQAGPATDVLALPVRRVGGHARSAADLRARQTANDANGVPPWPGKVLCARDPPRTAAPSLDRTTTSLRANTATALGSPSGHWRVRAARNPRAASQADGRRSVAGGGISARGQEPGPGSHNAGGSAVTVPLQTANGTRRRFSLPASCPWSPAHRASSSATPRRCSASSAGHASRARSAPACRGTRRAVAAPHRRARS